MILSSVSSVNIHGFKRVFQFQRRQVPSDPFDLQSAEMGHLDLDSCSGFTAPPLCHTGAPSGEVPGQHGGLRCWSGSVPASSPAPCAGFLLVKTFRGGGTRCSPAEASSCLLRLRHRRALFHRLPRTLRTSDSLLLLFRFLKLELSLIGLFYKLYVLFFLLFQLMTLQVNVVGCIPLT